MIYDRPISVLMQDAAAELSPPYTVGEIIAWFAQHYPKIKASSVRAHIKGLTANDPSRHHYQVGGRPALFMRQPDKTLMPYDVMADTDTDDDAELDDEPGLTQEVTLEQSSEFVLEAHLEEFLVGNWKSIDWGRPLEIWNGPDGESGHQLVTAIGRLDFLCSDRLADALIVVELKRGRPSTRSSVRWRVTSATSAPTLPSLASRSKDSSSLMMPTSPCVTQWPLSRASSS